MLPGLAGISGLVGAPRTITYLSESSSGTDSTSYTVSGASFGAARSDRYIVCTVTTHQGGAITSATIGGVSATSLVAATSGNERAALIIALVPTGTTGDVVVNFTGTSDFHSVGIYSITGISSATPIDTDSNTTAGALTLTSETGGVIIGLVYATNGVTAVSWSGATEGYEDVFGNNVFASAAAGNTTSTSTVLTPTLTGSATDYCFVAAAF